MRAKVTMLTHVGLLLLCLSAVTARVPNNALSLGRVVESGRELGNEG
jgi:hypothetical protein